MKCIGVLCSGGDGPGFNPCIRAVVRTALGLGMRAMGIERGYEGLIDGRMREMDARSVGGIIGRGGTVLGTARSDEFKTVAGRKKALRNLNVEGVDGLVVIGGDGSFRGALRLGEMGFPTVCIPGTIDNDIPYTDMSIGVDTALNTVLENIDRIKDTASSHRRAFLIEIMGRDCGYLTLMGGIAGGAEMVLIPEIDTPLDLVAAQLEDAYIRGKAHCIIAVAEGYRPGAQAVEEYLTERREELGFGVRVTVLGHVQRGGAPTAFDRLLATRLGCAAVRELHHGNSGIMIGLVGNEIVVTPLEKVCSEKKALDLSFYEMARVLER